MPSISQIAVCLLIFSSVVVARAQSSNEEIEIEKLYDQFETTETKRSSRKNRKKIKKQRVEKELSRVSDLVQLNPFSDIAVIQRRYLPKTERFELSGAGLISTNNAFFSTFGASLRLGYYFTENLGLEVGYTFFTNSERDITKTLKDPQKISTRSLVQPESYSGISLKWQPLYGKMALFDKKIVPFDIYFAPGVGVTETALGQNEFTISLGTGQLFALSKSLAFRWDFVWNFYTAEIESVDGSQTTEATSNHNDLLLMLGFSFFMPEAKYR